MGISSLEDLGGNNSLLQKPRGNLTTTNMHSLNLKLANSYFRQARGSTTEASAAKNSSKTSPHDFEIIGDPSNPAYKKGMHKSPVKIFREYFKWLNSSEEGTEGSVGGYQ